MHHDKGLTVITILCIILSILIIGMGSYLVVNKLFSQNKINSQNNNTVQCSSQCSLLGIKQCIDDNSYSICNYDPSGCLMWSTSIPCPANTRCQDGFCVLEEIQSTTSVEQIIKNDQSTSSQSNNVQCTSGSCCDAAKQTFKTSVNICQSKVNTEYGCPWGNQAGGNIGVRYQDKYCSGVSANCTGSLKWSSWSVYKKCESNKTCDNGACVVQTITLKCSDGTPYAQCSSQTHKYCDRGALVDKASICGCSSGYTISEDSCIVATPTYQCLSGTCCDLAQKQFKSSNVVCQNQINTEYGCPWGNQTGGAIGVRSQNRYCSGSSSDCSGTLQWSDWNFYQQCSSNQSCGNSACISLQCSDGTPYGQCSSQKPQYCSNGTLINQCSSCSCSAGQSCQTNGACVNNNTPPKNYKMVFVLVDNASNPATQDDLDTINTLKTKTSETFLWATLNLASMDTTYPVVTLRLENSPSIVDISKEFYKTNPDNFDFITIFNTYDSSGTQYHTSIKNSIKGTGMDIYDSTSGYGSAGKLQGLNWMKNIDMYKYTGFPPLETVLTTSVNGILHETSHQWGAFVDFMDENGQIGNALRNPYNLAHWDKKLETGYDLLNGFSWVDNGNGTFTAKNTVDYKKGYSNLDLYLMCLISKDNVGPIQLIVSNDDTQYIQPGTTITGTMKNISIQQIINAEGNRECP